MRKKMFYLIPALTISLFSSMTVYAEEPIAAATKASAEEESKAAAETDAEEDPVDHIYTFTLNETTYTLPCAVTEFTDNGWNLGSGTLDAHTYANTIGFYEGSQNSIAFEILNQTDDDGVDINELIVIGITVTNANITEDDYTFETADGIVPGMTVDEVKEVYGEPDFEHETYMSYQFQKRYEAEGLRDYGVAYAEEDEFTLYLEEDTVDRVQLEYFGIETEEDAE